MGKYRIRGHLEGDITPVALESNDRHEAEREAMIMAEQIPDRYFQIAVQTLVEGEEDLWYDVFFIYRKNLPSSLDETS